MIRTECGIYGRGVRGARNLSLRTSETFCAYIGMLSVLGTVVVKYVAKGYSVELPFGTLRANATGTCASIQDGFSAGTRNRQLGILFSADEAALSAVRSGLEYWQIAPDTTGAAQTSWTS